jgi:hypothetical protein
MEKDFILNGDQIEISLSKVKLTFLLLGSLLFVIGGVLFILFPAEFQGTGYRNRPQWEILTVGYVCAIFFGACGIIAILQLFNSKPGLIIDNSGITIPGLFSSAFIAWNMIDKFDIINISRTKLVAIYLKNPNEYIEKLSNPTVRKLALFNLNNYGAPLSISANSLKCNTNELLTFLRRKLKNSEIENPNSEIKLTYPAKIKPRTLHSQCHWWS